MNFIKTDIDGVFIIEPKIFNDERGYFFESYNENEFRNAGIDVKFVQDNQSMSKSYGIIRGLHAQSGIHSQSKLVRVLEGKVLDVAVDIRENSPTFGKYVSVELSDVNGRQLFIPHGFLHGFAVLSDSAVFVYKCDNFYCKESEISVRYDDPDIGINWQIPDDNVIVSEKDSQAQRLKDVINNR